MCFAHLINQNKQTNLMTPEQLQELYFKACIYGYADFEKIRYSEKELEAIALRRKITLSKPILPCHKQ